MLHTAPSTAVTINNDDQIEEIKKNIDLIIVGSLPYYKSIFIKILSMLNNRSNEMASDTGCYLG